MFTPPAEVSAALAAFAPLFTEPSWLRAQALLCGSLLAPANHPLTAALRALGLARAARLPELPPFAQSGPLSRPGRPPGCCWACWSRPLCPRGRSSWGSDELLERRRGRKLTARAIYRDAARSSKSCFQKSSGLRWMSVALLVPVGWAARVSRAAFPYRPVPVGTLRPLRAPGPAAQA